MNVALILAGGSGTRTEQSVPKQFISIYEKPIIIYTLEAFQKHPQIDKILVVCLDGWHEILWAYARQYRITKLAWAARAGENGMLSIRNGIWELKKYCVADDIVLVHDAIRPNVSQEIISGCIAAHDKELPFSSYLIQRSQRKNTAQSEKCRVFSDRHGMWV